ncbi:MFS transporter [Murdochiella sp. Marseille-P8839]|nr:MFS transporter [Murdochiella sp. Marseille-P8839]
MLKGLKKKFTPAEFSWVLYDVANSAFTMLATTLIPIWFKVLAITGEPGGLTSDEATGHWALSVSIVTVIVALLGPIFGNIVDYRRYKNPFFTTTLAIGTIGCILFGVTTSWLLFLILFIFVKIAYSASLTFYDSMLVDVTTPERMDEVSSHGYAWGYIGSCIPFLIALIAYVMDEMLHILDPGVARLIGCVVTAVWWFAVTIPLLKTYEQKHYVQHEAPPLIDSFSRVGQTLMDIVHKERKVFLFLIAFFMYIDGVGTIINNAINIGTDLGLDTVGQVIVLLATQVVAFAFSLLFARLSRTYRTATLIMVCIAGYLAVSLYALTLHSLWQFGIMAFGVGMFQGAIQALSRSYYSKIIPPQHAGEYFGIYDIFAKGASFLGSFAIALVKYAGGTINIAVATLAIFFILGFIFMWMADRVPDQRENTLQP